MRAGRILTCAILGVTGVWATTANEIGADEPVPPNIVFIMTDDQTVEDMRFMPKTQALLGAQGTTYENSWTSLSWCCPSRATLKTGQHAHNHGVYSNALPAGGFIRFQDETALPVWLQNAGYHTIHIGKAMNDTKRSVPAGWDRWQATLAGDHKMYNWKTIDQDGRVTSYGTKTADYQGDVYAQMVVDEINNAGPDPFFIHYTPSAPHRGTSKTPVPPRRHLNTFDEPLPRTPSFNIPPNFTNTEISQLAKEYRRRAESLFGADDAVEQIVRALEASGQIDNTVIVFTSDNGFVLGEHGLYGKSNYYREAMAVPLIIRGPGFTSGAVESAPVQNIDLAVTAADLAGATPLITVDGISLTEPLSADRGLYFESKRDDPSDPLWEGVRGERFVFVKSFQNSNGDRLWDMDVDPWQLDNFVDDPDYDAVENMLRAQLEAVRECAGASCFFEIDNAALEALLDGTTPPTSAPTTSTISTTSTTTPTPTPTPTPTTTPTTVPSTIVKVDEIDPWQPAFTVDRGADSTTVVIEPLSRRTTHKYQVRLKIVDGSTIWSPGQNSGTFTLDAAPGALIVQARVYASLGGGTKAWRAWNKVTLPA